MTTLTITRGLPGSGKTTEALSWVDSDLENRVRVNRDELRGNLYGQFVGLSYQQEQAVTVAQQAAVRDLLRSGKSVIVDDTNLRLRNARAWCDLALAEGVDFDVIELDTPVDECVKRDAARDRVVGEQVIRGMAGRFATRPEIKPSERKTDTPPAKYVPDLTQPSAWLIDIDGTLAHMGDRNPYDTTTVSQDTPDQTIVALARALHDWGHEIVVMSGRTEECREDTIRWLLHNGVDQYAELHMRATGDNRADYKVKADLFDTHVRNRWDVQGVLDDRTQVVKMWRSMGLKCLQVAEGDF